MNGEGHDLINAWADGWNSGNLECWLSHFADDCLYEDVAFGSLYRGSAELLAFAEGMRAAFPDLRVEIRSRVATDRSGAAEWEMSGTHRGDLPGLPALDKTFCVRGATVFVFKSGRIYRCSDYWDQASLLRQIGDAAGEAAA